MDKGFQPMIMGAGIKPSVQTLGTDRPASKPMIMGDSPLQAAVDVFRKFTPGLILDRHLSVEQNGVAHKYCPEY